MLMITSSLFYKKEVLQLKKFVGISICNKIYGNVFTHLKIWQLLQIFRFAPIVNRRRK